MSKKVEPIHSLGYRKDDILIEVVETAQRKVANRYKVLRIEDPDLLFLEDQKSGGQNYGLMDRNFFLFERSSLDHRLGNKVISLSPKAKGLQGVVRVINPKTEEFLVEFPACVDETFQESGFDELWFPKLITLQPGHSCWFKQTEVSAWSDELADNKNRASPVELSEMVSWLQELYEKKSAQFGHVFILHGNVFDLQQNQEGKYLTLQQYLEEIFAERELFMSYCLSAGLQFKNEEMERSFRERYLPKAKPQPPPEKPVNHQSQIDLARSQRFGRGDSFQLSGFRENRDSVNRGSAEASPKIKDSGNLVFLITPSLERISQPLRSGYSGIVQIRIPKPNQEQRSRRWEYLKSIEGVSFEKGLTATMLGYSTSGLSLQHLDEINRLSQVKKQDIGLAFIRERKKRIFQDEVGGLINVLNSGYGFENFGGRPELIEYLMRMQYYMLNGIYKSVPVGILSPGPPGTGKTLIWQCFAHEAGINCVSIGNLRNPYVGSSEQRTDAVFSYLDDLQPLVVIEDEADQSEASRDESTGDSGVSNRIRQKKFEFCSDPSRRGRIIWVRLTNRLDLIDSAYRRKGRTDEVMPFVLPEVGEMVDIFKVKFKEYGIVTSITDFSSFAMAAKERIYVTGADIDWMVREADMLATDKNEEIVRSEHLFQSISDWEMQADKIDMNRQIIMALKTGSKRFLPAGWQQILSEAQSRLSELTHAQGYVDDPNSGGSYQNSNFN